MYSLYKQHQLETSAFTVNESITEVKSASECAGLSDTSLWDHFIYDNETKTCKIGEADLMTLGELLVYARGD